MSAKCWLCRGSGRMGFATLEDVPNDVTIPPPDPNAWHPPGTHHPITKPVVYSCHDTMCRECYGSGTTKEAAIRIGPLPEATGE